VEMVVGKTEVDPGNNLSGVRNEGERSPSIYFSCAENRCMYRSSKMNKIK
jgi:hypothetical protein